MMTDEFISYVRSCAPNSHVTSIDFSIVFLYSNMGMSFVLLNTFTKA